MISVICLTCCSLLLPNIRFKRSLPWPQIDTLYLNYAVSLHYMHEQSFICMYIYMHVPVAVIQNNTLIFRVFTIVHFYLFTSVVVNYFLIQFSCKWPVILLSLSRAILTERSLILMSLQLRSSSKLLNRQRLAQERNFSLIIQNSYMSLDPN